MGVIHAGIHTLASLWGVCVASITSNEDPLIYGEFRGYSLTN
jgi:hypothetical protein